jgi:hypothetical protein
MKFGGRDRDRTCDLMLAKHALSQLSYTPTAVTIIDFKAFATLSKLKHNLCTFSCVRTRIHGKAKEKMATMAAEMARHHLRLGVHNHACQLKRGRGGLHADLARMARGLDDRQT